MTGAFNWTRFSHRSLFFHLAFKRLFLSFYFTKLAEDIKKRWIPEIYFVPFFCRKLTGFQFYISAVFSRYLVFSEIRNLKNQKSFSMKVLCSCLKFKKYHNLISAPLFWRRRRRRIFYRRRYYRRRRIWRRRYYYRRRYYRRRSLFWRRRYYYRRRYYRRRSFFYRRRSIFYRRRFG